MKTYALYSWRADDEGGISMCFASDWSPRKDYYPRSGWRARPSVLIGEFDTIHELAELLMVHDNNWKERVTFDKWLEEAQELIDEFLEEYNSDPFDAY